MNDLQIFNNPTEECTDRTPIEVLLQVGEDERVSARDTYGFLSPGQDDFARWAKTNITDNQFAEYGADFTVTRIVAEFGNPLTGGMSKREMADYRLSVPFAKKLCMLSKTERGEQAREYFIKVEKALHTVAQRLPQLTTNEMVLQLAQSAVEMERQVNEVKAEVQQLGGKFDNAMKLFAAPGGDWVSSMNAKIRELASDSDGWADKRIRGKMYAELEDATGVMLSSRMKRLQARMKKQGASYKERMAVTKLDVIGRDGQLKAIFESIVKRYQAAYTQD